MSSQVAARMIAKGAGYVELAQMAAVAWEWATGVSIEVVEPPGEPYRAKLEQPDGWIVDADVLFLGKWEPPDLIEGAVHGQRAELFEVGAREIAGSFGVSLEGFINTGLMGIAGVPEQRQRALELFDLGVSQLHEETVFNIALKEARTPVVHLDGVQGQRGWNLGQAAAHLCGLRGCTEKMLEFRRLGWWFASEELKDLWRAAGVAVNRMPPTLEACRRGL